jgi:hypothetical protein
LLFSPSALFDGHGRRVVTLPELPPPSGGKMGWYHCFPADVCGDKREEVVLYDPYGDAAYIYTPAPLYEAAYGGYQHTARQYNARLLNRGSMAGRIEKPLVVPGRSVLPGASSVGDSTLSPYLRRLGWAALYWRGSSPSM